MNHVVLLGRLTENPQMFESELREEGQISIAVSRNFKNDDGIYETDIIKVKTFGTITKKITEYCQKGDLISITGRIQTTKDEIEIIAERISFLTNNGKGEE